MGGELQLEQDLLLFLFGSPQQVTLFTCCVVMENFTAKLTVEMKQIYLPFNSCSLIL